MQFTLACFAAPSQAASTNMVHAKELKQQHADFKVVIFDIYTPLRRLAEYSAARRIRLQMGNSSLSSFVAVRLATTTSSPRRNSLQHCGTARRNMLLRAEYSSLYVTIDSTRLKRSTSSRQHCQYLTALPSHAYGGILAGGHGHDKSSVQYSRHRIRIKNKS
jgi:hypothetical protein